jgi:hypothetical protein
MSNEIYRDDYMVIRPHNEIEDNRVAVYVGEDPDEATPHVADGEEIRDALAEFIEASEKEREDDGESDT